MASTTATTAPSLDKNVAATNPSSKAAWKHFLAGGVGGMTGAIVTSPFDVVKTRLQSDLFESSSSRQATSSSTKATTANTIKGSPINIAQQTALNFKARPQGVRGLVYHFVETSHMIRNIYVHEGPKALFKGLGPTLVGVVPARAINFSTYAHMKKVISSTFPSLVKRDAPGDVIETSPLVHLGAAVVAGVITATATNPIWVVKTRLQLEAKHRDRDIKSNVSKMTSTPSLGSAPLPKSGIAAAAATPSTVVQKVLPAVTMTRDILKREGIKGLYRGMSASYLGVSEGVIQWVLYERLKKMSTQKSETGKKSSALSEIAGIVGSSGGAKMVASLITYPHEVIRTRLRQEPPRGQAPKYTGLIQTLRLIVAEEGVGRLYGGLSAHLMRVVPNAACMFTIYEIALRL